MVEHVVLFFVDGLGVGRRDPKTNPMARVGGPCLNVFEGEPEPSLPFGGVSKPLDACLGVEGLPQSATGQTALLTGINAPRVLGRHLFGFPNRELREVILEHSLLKRVTEKGLKAAFLNAFRPRFFERGEAVWEQVPLSVTTWTNRAAGLPFFRLVDVTTEQALYQEFTNKALRKRGHEVPVFTPAKAGEILARRSLDFDLLLFEYFRTDGAGHSQNMEKAVEEIKKLEEFLQAFLSSVDLNRVLLILSSDHGNIEDLSTRGHTRNPAMTILWGLCAGEAAGRLCSIDEVPGEILRVLGTHE